MKAGSEGSLNDDGTVKTAAPEGTYGERVQALKVALAAKDEDAIADARKDLKDAGLRVGVDVTPPTAEFARSGLDEDARAIDDEFVVEVTDNKDGSGIHTGTSKGAPKALIASLEIRDAEGTKCIIDNEPSGSTRLCGDPFKGLSVDDDLVSTTIRGNIDDFTGYYTFTAQAQDKAGNKSEEISRVAVNDQTFDARASLRVRADRDEPSDYTVDITVDDDLSVRDYYLAMSSTETAPAGLDTGAEMRFRIGDLEEVDAYNAPDLTTDSSASEDITLPFLALQTSVGGDPVQFTNFDVYVRDQRGAASTDVTDDTHAVTGGLATAGGIGGTAYEAADIVHSGVTITLTPSETGSATSELDDGDDIELRVVVDVPDADVPGTRQIDETDPPFKRVYFYAESSDDNDGPRHWRLIDSLGRSAYDDPASTDTGEYVYEVEVNAGDLFGDVDDDGKGDYSGRVMAIGVWNDLEAVAEREASDPDGTPGSGDEIEAAPAETAVPGVAGLISVTAEIFIDP